MEVPDYYMPEWIPFDTKISLQIFLCSIAQHNFSADSEQNWTMKNDQKRHANSRAGHDTAPQSPVPPRLYLIVLGHRASLLPPRP
jgi:hypothetical protein